MRKRKKTQNHNQKTNITRKTDKKIKKFIRITPVSMLRTGTILKSKTLTDVIRLMVRMIS